MREGWKRRHSVMWRISTSLWLTSSLTAGTRSWACLAAMRALTLTVEDAGLVAANQKMTEWLRGPRWPDHRARAAPHHRPRPRS